MKPKNLVPEIDKQHDTLPEALAWGLVIHCLDCYEIHQDLRCIETKVVRATAGWLEANCDLLDNKEKEWCRGIADQDAAEKGNDDTIRRWSYEYAIVTVLLRKLLAKRWSDGIFDKKLTQKRRECEAYVLATCNEETDWALAPVAGKTRFSALERSLSLLEKP